VDGISYVLCLNFHCLLCTRFLIQQIVPEGASNNGPLLAEGWGVQIARAKVSLALKKNSNFAESLNAPERKALAIRGRGLMQ